MKLNIVKQMIKSVKSFFSNANNKTTFTPVYRIAGVLKDKHENYLVQVQLINRNLLFKMKPEEILAEDNLVDQFSPRDIRTLTYLGYLGINSPNYKILAKKLSENDDELSFFLMNKSDKKVIIKTASEILNEKDIIKNLDPEDAHIVGYTVASESVLEEKLQKEKLIKQIEKEMDADA
jgi:hypothetical protein